MAAGEQRDQQPLDDGVLPNHHFRHALADVLHEIGLNRFHGTVEYSPLAKGEMFCRGRPYAPAPAWPSRIDWYLAGHWARLRRPS